MLKTIVVLLPYEITLLSNKFGLKISWFLVLLPYEITLLSNHILSDSALYFVLLPYEITLLSNRGCKNDIVGKFYYLMKLHYSQTDDIFHHTSESFTTLWNYTTLKRRNTCGNSRGCFTTLWNYTTLKPCLLIVISLFCFTTLWNYTTLKLVINDWNNYCSFTTLWNYTTLKHIRTFGVICVVLLPYEITLLSNSCTSLIASEWFYYLMKLHYSQTMSKTMSLFPRFTTLWNYTTLKPL